jgi:gamma-glutamyltranspeptidase
MPSAPLEASGSRWAVAAPHRAAAEAAAEVFVEGGNAVDAALTAAVTLAVVYPHMCGVGGDLFALVRVPNGQTVAVNSSGRAPMALDLETVTSRLGGRPFERGPLSVTVPGAVAGWAALAAEGATIPWDRAFAPAIGFARDGMSWSSSLVESIASDEELFSSDPGMRAVFLTGGDRDVGGGASIVQTALAATLQAIAREGASALYDGEVGERYVGGLRAAGSPITTEDLRAHTVDVVPPLVGRYRDLDVRVVPPNSQGFVLLEILRAIERMELDPDPLGPDAGLIARVIRAAGLDRDRHNADPRTTRVPVSSLLEDEHIAALAEQAREGPARVEGYGRALSGDTVCLVTADADGRAVSLIQSLSWGFGSGILEPETGIVAHNRGSCFSLDPASRNRLEGGKRPAHTLMPVMVERAGRLAAVPGTMGGYAQPQINATNILRTFDLGMAPAETLGAPRWLENGMEDIGERTYVIAERDVPARTKDRLVRAGFDVESVPPRSSETGHSHLIRVDRDGTLLVGADPRSDGAAHAG